MDYYNDNDPKICAWLRELIKAKLIPEGVVDERSICDVKPADVAGFRRVHFFAGIGGWAYALELAGWPGDWPVWTGSCPCQPFSCAGKQNGAADERHLWPAWFNLIRQCRPERIFGEQVQAAIGLGWLDGVSADLETEGYAVGSIVLGAHGVGAPHIRQRLYWVADSSIERRQRIGGGSLEDEGSNGRKSDGDHLTTSSSPDNGLADPRCAEKRREPNTYDEPGSGASSVPGGAGGVIGVAHSPQRGQRTDGSASGQSGHTEQCEQGGGVEHATLPTKTRQRQESEHLLGATTFWSTAIWHQCRDGKARRIAPEPEIFPLAPGLSGRVVALCGAGNSIIPQVAATFIRAYLETLK